jgi:hypothetical protein
MIKALAFDPGTGDTSQCSAGYHFSDAFGGCVLDDPGVIVDVPGNATAPANFLMYAGIGLGLLLLLGALAGGRSSKSSGVAPGTRKKVTKSFWVTF